MIQVNYYGPQNAFTIERTFDDDIVPKILQSGALKLVRPAVIEVPPMGTTDEKAVPIVKEPEVVVAVFNGNYIMEIVE